jgi:agmatine deiminase
MGIPGVRWPAEWEPHRATWLAWPHHQPDWPGKFVPIPWVYAEIARVLAQSETVEVLCHDHLVKGDAIEKLAMHGVSAEQVCLHVVPTDRVWTRDSGPTVVHDAAGAPQAVHWQFNAWAKYDNHVRDAAVGREVARLASLPVHEPMRPTDVFERVVLEGGAIDGNGAGLLLTTEECLLSKVQERNRGMGRTDYERVFAEWLGIRKVIWLGEGCVGDDTHGHVDDIARFVSADTVLVAHEPDPSDENHRRSADNLRRLAKDAPELTVKTLPYPRPVMTDGVQLPASYANFYIANRTVLVPTFNDPNDRVALNIIAECFPTRTVTGIHAVDLVWGLGTLHCLTQQEPAAR